MRRAGRRGLELIGEERKRKHTTGSEDGRDGGRWQEDQGFNHSLAGGGQDGSCSGERVRHDLSRQRGGPRPRDDVSEGPGMRSADTCLDFSAESLRASTRRAPELLCRLYFGGLGSRREDEGSSGAAARNKTNRHLRFAASTVPDEPHAGSGRRVFRPVLAKYVF